MSDGGGGDERADDERSDEDAVTFSLRGNRLSAERWGRAIDDVLEARGDEMYADPSLVDDGQPVAWLIGEGSICGATLRLGNDGVVRLSLAPLASRVDWRTAFALLRRALTDGGGELALEPLPEAMPPDLFGGLFEGGVPAGEALTEALTDEIAERVGVAAFTAQARAMAAAGAAVLAFPTFELPLDASTLGGVRLGDVDAESMPRAEHALVERIGRYAVAYPAPTLSYGGRQAAVWALVPTLITPDIELLICDIGDGVPVAREVLCDRLGERAEAVGDLLYLPEVDPDEDAELLADLVDAAEDIQPTEEELEAAAAAIGRLEDAIGYLVRAVSTGEDPAAVDAALIERGLEDFERETLLALVLGALDLAQQGMPPDELADELLERGHSEEMIELLFDALEATFGEDE